MDNLQWTNLVNWILFDRFPTNFEKLIFDIKRRVEGKSYRRSITKNSVSDLSYFKIYSTKGKIIIWIN